jgi:hypothetical protein
MSVIGSAMVHPHEAMDYPQPFAYTVHKNPRLQDILLEAGDAF